MQKAYDYIDNTINIMIIDDDPVQCDIINDILKPARLFSLSIVSTNREALSLFRSGKRFHVCILDLGICDIDNDEFFILRNYSAHCSIVVRTGSDSPLKGANSIQLGAKAVLEKGKRFILKDFYKTICKYALINIVNYRYSELSSDTLCFATKVLFEKNPESVTEWAERMRITDRQLRNLWRTCMGFSAKQILFLYHLYQDAFNYYQFDIIGEPHNPDEPKKDNDKSYRTYFQNNREVLTFMLS